jgi:peptidoglycan/LPS O-acetylase OafA/YrhL
LSRALQWKGLSWTGRISYSLYLWQQLFLPVPEVSDSLGRIQHFPQNVIFAFTIATVSYYLIERPFIAFGRAIQNNRVRREATL